MQEESKEKSKDAPFESIRILSERWKNGTFSEIIDDWKWIFDTVNRTVSLNLITNIFKTTSGIFTERNFRIVATKTMQHAFVVCPIATFFPVIIIKFVYLSIGLSITWVSTLN